MDGVTNPAGGWGELAELYASSLVSSDVATRRPVGRLARQVPSLEDGTIEVLADGRMQVTFVLRGEAVWHDGVPFTARDLVFSHAFLKDRGLPVSNGNRVVNRMADTAAPDDHTFVVFFGQPYYQAATLGFYHFGPVPRHVLGPAYERYRETGSPDEVVNLTYWTTEHVNLGPYRVLDYRPGEEMVLQAHDRYFLGQPRIKTIYVREFGEANTLFSSLLAGAVDMVTVAALSANLGFELEQRWRESPGGMVQLVPGGGVHGGAAVAAVLPT